MKKLLTYIFLLISLVGFGQNTKFNTIQYLRANDTITWVGTQYWAGQTFAPLNHNQAISTIYWLQDSLTAKYTKTQVNYLLLTKQNVSDTSVKDATRYWVGLQDYLNWSDTTILITRYDTSTFAPKTYVVTHDSAAKQTLRTEINNRDTLVRIYARDRDALKLNVTDTSNSVRIWKYDAVGDLFKGTGNNTYDRLAIGTDRKFLRSNGTTMLWDTVKDASATSRGLLTSTDWTTFNAKQSALTNPVTGTGTSGYLPHFTGTSTIDSSNLYYDALNKRLGIGTTNPLTKLDVFTPNAALPTGAITTRTDLVGIKLGDRGAGVVNTKVAIWADLGNIQSGMVLGREGTLWGSYVAFHTRPDNVSSLDDFTERMRINNAGNVGIGTTTPQSKVDIEGSLAVGSTYSGTSAAPANGLIVEGNVGIGTNAPAAKLVVKGGFTALYGNADGVAGQIISFEPSTTAAGGTSKIYSTFNAGASEGALALGTWSNQQALFIKTDGNVGIGTSTPSSKLHIVGSARVSDSLKALGKVYMTGIPAQDTAKKILGYNVATGEVKAMILTGNVFTQGLNWNESTDTYARTGSLTGYALNVSPGNAALPIQSQMKGCLLLNTGLVNYYLHDDDWTKKEFDGSTASDLTGTDGQVMVEIPKFWIKYSYVNSVHSYSISSIPQSGYKVHPAFVKDGVEVEFRYIGAYEGNLYSTDSSAYIENHPSIAEAITTDWTHDKLSSVSGKWPVTNGTRAQYRTIAANRGTGWRQMDYDLVNALEWLILIEYGTFYIQNIAEVGPGITNVTDWAAYNDYYPIAKPGNGNSIGNISGDNAGATACATEKTKYSKYRGIENFYGHIWKFVDGININSNVPYITNNSAAWADDTSTGYTDPGVTLANSNDYQKTLVNSSRLMLPATVGGASTTYITDYYYQASGWRVAFFGGSAHDGAAEGPWYWYLYYDSTTATRYIGARISY